MFIHFLRLALCYGNFNETEPLSIFQASSKRQCDYVQFQKFTETEIHKILHPSQTRWLSVAAVVKRLLEQWNALQVFFSEKKHVERLHSVENIYNTLHDPFSKMYFLFLDFILPKITKMNELFQAEKVLIADLYNTMLLSYKELLNLFLKRDYINRNDIWDVDPTDKNNFLDLKHIYLGVHVLNELNSDIVKCRPDLINYFLEKCRDFLSILCKEIQKRFDFKHNLLSTLDIFKPEKALSGNQMSLLQFYENFPRCIGNCNIQSIDEQWRLLSQYTFKLGEINPNVAIDKFWSNLLTLKNSNGDTIFEDVASFVLNILSLPHSNAACERVFSQVNLVKTKQRNKLITNTINGNLLTNQFIKKEFTSCYNFKSTPEMLNKMTKNIIYSKGIDINENEEEFIIV